MTNIVPRTNLDVPLNKAQLQVLVDMMSKFIQALQEIRTTREQSPQDESLEKTPDDENDP